MRIINITQNFVSALLVLSLPMITCANETTAEKAETMKNKAVDKVKETYRDAEDRICEMVNGKVECLPQTAENKGKTVTEKVITKAKDEKNKID